VVFFDYGDAEAVQLLYGKSRYVTPEFERYEEQAQFDGALERTGIDLSGFGPDAVALEGALRERGLKVERFELVPVHAGAAIETENMNRSAS
jgi:hypothetical protein